MSVFSRLESLLSSQHSSESTKPLKYLETEGCASVSIAILNHGEVSSHNLSCVGDNTETVFQACSISKVIAALACLKLVEGGQFSLDSTLDDCLASDVLQKLKTERTETLLGCITVKHLLTHMSGLKIHGIPGYHNDPPKEVSDILEGRRPARTPQVHLESLPGLFSSYSGGALTVLQAVLENISGKDYRSLTKELVLDPLLMTMSFYGSPESNGVANFAKAYYTAHTMSWPPYHNFREDAAAGLWTTPTDLLKLIHALQISLKADEQSTTYLKKALVRQMLTETAEGKGLVMACSKEPGLCFGHAGDNYPGYTCIAVGFADLSFATGGEPTPKGKDMRAKQPAIPDECGFCIMTNSPRGDEIYEKLGAAISYSMDWPNISMWGAREKPVPFADYDAVNPKGWTRWIGKWVSESGLSLDIMERLSGKDKGSPFLRYNSTPNLPDLRLVPAAGRPNRSIQKEVLLFVIEGLNIGVYFVNKSGTLKVKLRHGTTDGVEIFQRPS
ncbi:MAG: hypothetical protein Q9227_009334 [Pyrenula ochraceoflavens]